MKKILISIIALLTIFIAVLPVAAAMTPYEIDSIGFLANEDYTVYTEDDLLPSSKVEGLVFVALSSDHNHQIQGRRTETEFSKQLGSFKDLDKETVAPVGTKLFPNGYETVQMGSILYLKSTEQTDGDFTVMYTTVADGKLYTFTYFGTDPTRIGEFISTVTIPDTAKSSGMKTFMIVLFVIFIIADIIFIILLALSFAKDYRRRKMEMDKNIVNQYIKIKRRRY